MGYIIMALVGYLGLGYLFHLAIFPEPVPEIGAYFKPGDEFFSKTEGFRQTVVRQEKGLVYCTLEVLPFAAGPPEHIHSGFDEYFEVANGEISVLVNGEVKKVRPGEVLHIPAGVPHKPFNETAETIRLKGEFGFPEKFAFYLSQVYGLMDEDPNFGKMPGTLFQMSLFQPGFDSYIAEGPPVVVQKGMAFLLRPAARAMGYKSFIEVYNLRRKE